MFFEREAGKDKAKKLPRLVEEYIRDRFILLPQYLDMLRCFEYNGTVSGKGVRCINIFSLNGTCENSLSIRSNIDLEQHPEMLLFKGYIDNHGNVYMADRRAPLKQLKVR